MTKLPEHLEKVRDELAGSIDKKIPSKHESISDPYCCPEAFIGGFNACYEEMKGLVEDVQKVLNRAIIYNVPPLNDRMVGAEIKTEITKILKKFRGV